MQVFSGARPCKIKSNVCLLGPASESVAQQGSVLNPRLHRITRDAYFLLDLRSSLPRSVVKRICSSAWLRCFERKALQNYTTRMFSWSRLLTRNIVKHMFVEPEALSSLWKHKVALEPRAPKTTQRVRLASLPPRHQPSLALFTGDSTPTETTFACASLLGRRIPVRSRSKHS